MKNLFLCHMHEKDAEHITTDTGLYLRRVLDKPFKKACTLFTGANMIPSLPDRQMEDDAYFKGLSLDFIPRSFYPLKQGKNNIVLERYPDLEPGEPYIFVCNHTCPEDIETVLNVLDRNAYLILGSIESLRYNPEMYLTWLNGMIPFDIMDQAQRTALMGKMERVLKTNSILIFPEGSHNYSPNHLINPLYDGPANLALRTGRKIVAVTMLRDGEHGVSYADVSQPVEIADLIRDQGLSEKQLVKQITARVRDKMATAVYYILARHFEPISRADYRDIEHDFRQKIAQDVFSKLKWEHDVFDAEYLTKKPQAQREQEEVIHTLAALRLPEQTVRDTELTTRSYVQLAEDLREKNVPGFMREYWSKL